MTEDVSILATLLELPPFFPSPQLNTPPAVVSTAKA